MTAEDADIVDSHLALLDSTDSSEASTSIISNMVSVVEVQEYAFLRERGWRIRPPKEYDIVPLPFDAIIGTEESNETEASDRNSSHQDYADL